MTAFLATFIIVEIIMLGITFISIDASIQILAFFYTATTSIIPTTFFWFFTIVGILLLILGLIVGYLRLRAGYILAVVSAILIGMVFSSTEQMALILSLV